MSACCHNEITAGTLAQLLKISLEVGDVGILYVRADKLTI